MHILQKLIQEHNFKQVMINPYAMSHYLKHLNSRKKDDVTDSKGIAKFIQTLNLSEFRTVFNQDEKTLRKYTSSINLLRKLDTQLRNFIHSQKMNPDLFLDDLLLSLKSKISEVKKNLEKEAKKILIDLFPYVETINKEIKGVGYALLLELIPIFLKSREYNIKQLQSFVGLSPRVFESGSSVFKKNCVSKCGDSLVRKLLYLSTISALRNNEIIKQKYVRLIESGKPSMIALVACMSHLFRAVYYKFNKGLVNV